MAQAGYTPISLYYSTTTTNVPTNTNLVNGELAINITDGKLFYKDNSNVVQTLATKGTAAIGGSNTQVQYNSSGSLAGSANLTFDGSNLQLGAQGDLRFADSDSSNWVAFQAAATITSNVTWTLPSTDGSNGQVLSTNGSGALSWASTVSTPGGSDTQIQYNSSNTFAGASGLTTDGSNLTVRGQGDVRFADSDSSNWVAFQGAATIASNVTWTLPNADGSSGQVLTTDGSGTLSWATSSGGITQAKATAIAMVFGF